MLKEVEECFDEGLEIDDVVVDPRPQVFTDALLKRNDLRHDGMEQINSFEAQILAVIVTRANQAVVSRFDRTFDLFVAAQETLLLLFAELHY